jgi:hypothetical protein
VKWKRIFIEIFLAVIITVSIFGALTYTADAMGKYCSYKVGLYPPVCYWVRPNPIHRPGGIPPNRSHHPNKFMTPTPVPYPNPYP